VTPTICPGCGGNLSLIGRVHRCVPRHVTVPEPMLPLPAPPDRHVANVSHVANSGMANTAASTPGRKRSSPTYRYRNPDKRRTYQRDLMRQRRATGGAA
jgi:hypothetical protein